MLNLLFTSVLELSLSTGLVVAVFLALSPVLGKTVWPRWRCLLWTLLALRLLLPFSLPGQDAPVHLSLPTQAVSAPVVSTPSAPASDQTSSEAAAAASPTWLDLSALAWAAGGTGFLAWQGIAYIRFRRRILRRQHREADPQLQALFQDLAIQMGLARPVSLVVSENAPSPITLGLVGLGREGWGVEIGAGASVAADEALFSQAGQGGHQGGQGPGSMVPQLLENLAGGQRGLGGPKNLHDLQLRLPQALAVTRGHGITSGQNYLG